MKSFTTIALSLLAAVSSVSAHGFVSGFIADGKEYKGNTPNNNRFDSPIRLISSPNPNKGANNPALNCGPNAQKAKIVAPVTAGSTVQFAWAAGGGVNWPHNTGPVINYMAKCDGDCADFDSANARWFKVSQDGRNSNGAWVQADLMSGKTVSMTVPKQIASGQYLIRHEIIALHLATNKGGAEFYPSCIQVEVKGGGSSVPDETVSFPGAYSDEDPGIFDPNVFNARSRYEFPGPAVATFNNGGSRVSTPPETPGDGDDNNAEPTPTPTLTAEGDYDTEPTPTPVSASSEPATPSSSQNCKASGEHKRMAKRHFMYGSH